jgi:uncharacterized protein
MAIEIAKTFSVAAPIDEVWRFLIDPEKVASCLPGASITERIDEESYAGALAIKVGPVSASYKGKIKFEKRDANTHTVEIIGSGQDVRGKGGADMKMVSTLVATDSGTDAEVTSQVNVTGILAQFGRGMIDAVSDEMFDEFTRKMREELEGAGAPESGTTAVSSDAVPNDGPHDTVSPAAVESEALDVVSFGARVGTKMAGRMVRAPGFWISVVIVGVAIYWFSMR